MNYKTGKTYNSVLELVEQTIDDPLLVEEFRAKIFKKFIHEYRYARTLTGTRKERAFDILDHMAEGHIAGEFYEPEGYGIIWGVLESEAGLTPEASRVSE